MSKNQTYMPFFYDWCMPFSALDGEDCKKLLLAMVDYHQNGGKIPTFSGMAGMAASFVFPQLERARDVSVSRAMSGAKGGKANQSKTKQTEATNTNTITNTNTSTNTNTNTNTNTSPDPHWDRESRFAAFWERYPKKQNKVLAKTAWEKIDPDDALLQRILSAIDRQKQWPSWQTEEGRYIPSPSSWLNQRRWEDERTQLPPPQMRGMQSSIDSIEDFAQAAIRRSLAEAGKVWEDP